MKLGKIYYLIDDIFSPRFNIEGMVKNAKQGSLPQYLYRCVSGHNRAVGGIKMDYLHCMLLRDAGYDATPLLLGKHSGNVYGYDIETARIDDIGFELNENDVIVSNEYNPYNGMKFSNCIKVVFVQGWSTIDKKIKPEDCTKTYRDFGYDYVMCCSRYTASYIRQKMQLDAEIITNGIDDGVFYPDPKCRVKKRILCLPRKNKQDIDEIRQLVTAQNPDAEFVEVDNLTQDQLALEYRKSDVFLATGYPEGFALPPLEAMASGCVVVGFTGGGASEFMIDGETALVAGDGDCATAATRLLDVLADEELKESIRSNGLEISRNYTLDQMQQQLVQFFKKIEDAKRSADFSFPSPNERDHSITATR